MRGARALVGPLLIVLALGACGSGGDDGGSVRVDGDPGEVDCAALEPVFVADAVVGSFLAEEDGSTPGPLGAAEIRAAVDALPAGLAEPLADLDEMVVRGEALEAERDDADTSPERYEEVVAELDEMEQVAVDRLLPAMTDAWEWSVPRCAGDRVVWSCEGGASQARFRPVGQAIGEDGASVAEVGYATPEEAIEVEGWTEVHRDDVEAVFARLDDDGRAVQVRSAEREEGGWTSVYDLSCPDPAGFSLESEGSFEPIPAPIETSTPADPPPPGDGEG